MFMSSTNVTLEVIESILELENGLNQANLFPRNSKKWSKHGWKLMKKNYWNNGKELKIMTLLQS